MICKRLQKESVSEINKKIKKLSVKKLHAILMTTVTEMSNVIW